jgi:uncharacterized protein (TIGR00299 family) protein
MHSAAVRRFSVVGSSTGAVAGALSGSVIERNLGGPASKRGGRMQTSDTRDHTVFAVDHASRGMRTLAVDGRMGASGDMLLGALVAAGADPAVLSVVEDSIDVRYEARETTKNGISATAVDVLLDSDDGSGDDDGGDGHDHGHSDEHSHDHDHSGEHSHDHDHTHAEGRGPQRTYAEVVDIVESMGLPEGVEADALAVFELLGRAEASVHGTDLASTHFHEVGADDAIADVVGTCLLLADLDVTQVVTTPLAAGGGTVEMSHGTYPVPTPAVVELAEDAQWSLRGGPVDVELLTPTGAAILAHVADGVDALPAMQIEGSGNGAGAADVEDRPNVLRAIVGTADGSLGRESITVLETNVDDVSPEYLGGLQATLQDAGALDVTILPTTMKKSRPGHLVKVIVAPEDAEAVARRLAEETGTLGVRASGASHRWVAERETVTATVEVDGHQYEVAVKVATGNEEVFDVSAEFDDALAVARETDLPVREVARLAEASVER